MKLSLIALVLCVTNCARAEVSRVLWEEVTQLLWKVDDLFLGCLCKFCANLAGFDGWFAVCSGLL